MSKQNSKNRMKTATTMPHLTGSMPHREIIYEKVLSLFQEKILVFILDALR